MANFNDFVSNELESGTDVDIYYTKLDNIGNGQVKIKEELHLKIHGKGTFLFKDFDDTVEITMPDANSTGTCTMVIDGTSDDCSYKVDKDKLIINHPTKGKIKFHKDNKWTWIEVTAGSFGLKKS